jgi:hypothetical protein
MTLPDLVTQKLSGLSAPAAYDLLAALGHANVFIYLQGQLVVVKDWVKDDEVAWLPANNTPETTFWGGPPTKLGYYQGNLYILLLDRIYDYLLTHTLGELYQTMGITPKQRTFQWLSA